MKKLAVFILSIICFFVFFGLSCKKEVDVTLNVDFEFFAIDSNYTIPAKLNFVNKTTGAKQYKWTFQNGSPEIYNERNPGIILFTKADTVKVTLEAWNDFDRKTKTIYIIIDSVTKANFIATPRINNIAPVEFDFQFSGAGATSFDYNFGVAPFNSILKNPQQVLYANAGVYPVKLTVKNNRGKMDTITKLLTVRPPLFADFDIIPSFDDEDYEAPFIGYIKNNTISGLTHLWQVTGGSFNNSTDTLPIVTLNNPGTYAIKYTVGNGKQNQIVTKNITILPNTGMRKFTNIKFGINTASNTIGCYFSTYLRKSFIVDSVNNSNGAFIDLCFFGLNSSFSFNKFLSPNEVNSFTFPTIPNATNTVLINKQEVCGCGVNITPSDFNSISNGNYFNSIPINSTNTADFNNSILPRVVAFKNANGKKGALLIKQYVNDGPNSYILTDIIVQKD